MGHAKVHESTMLAQQHTISVLGQEVGGHPEAVLQLVWREAVRHPENAHVFRPRVRGSTTLWYIFRLVLERPALWISIWVLNFYVFFFLKKNYFGTNVLASPCFQIYLWIIKRISWIFHWMITFWENAQYSSKRSLNFLLWNKKLKENS